MKTRYICPGSNATLISVLDLETGVIHTIHAKQAFYANELFHCLKAMCEEFEHTPCSSMLEALAVLEKAENINANA